MNFCIVTIESLSTDVFEARTATGRLMFKVLATFYLQKLVRKLSS